MDIIIAWIEVTKTIALVRLPSSSVIVTKLVVNRSTDAYVDRGNVME